MPVNDLTKDAVKSALNPYNIEELTYICKPCKLNAYNKDDIKKAVLKAEAKKKSEESLMRSNINSSHSSITVSSTTALIPPA